MNFCSALDVLQQGTKRNTISKKVFTSSKRYKIFFVFYFYLQNSRSLDKYEVWMESIRARWTRKLIA